MLPFGIPSSLFLAMPKSAPLCARSKLLTPTRSSSRQRIEDTAAERAEIAPPQFRRGNREHERASLVLPQPLVVAEEEHSVPQDGAAQRAAELVGLERRLGCRKEIPRVERVVTVVLE